MTRHPQPLARPTVARLRGPGEVVAALPHLCGFVPTDSAVLMSLHGPRQRVGLVVRLDLDALRDGGSADQLLRPLLTDAPDEALLVLCADDPVPAAGELPLSALAAEVRRACAAVDVPLREALLVAGGRWWSYDCVDPRCCPREGQPVPAADAPALGLLAAESVLAGRRVLPDRAALAASLAPPRGALAAEAARARAAAERTRRDRVGSSRPDRTSAGDLVLWREAIRCAGEGGLPDLAGAAALVVALDDVGVRDEVLSWAAEQGEALLALLHALATLTPEGFDAPLCTVLAVTAWAHGDGALANVALDRALRSRPTYSLALLARAGLDRALPPAEVRRWLAACGRS